MSKVQNSNSSTTCKGDQTVFGAMPDPAPLAGRQKSGHVVCAKNKDTDPTKDPMDWGPKVEDQTAQSHPQSHGGFTISDKAMGARKQQRKRDLHDDFDIDPRMKAAFVKANEHCITVNLPNHKTSNKFNQFITINQAISRRRGKSPETTLKDLKRVMRRLFGRNYREYCYIWRCEIGTGNQGGHHYHIAFHCPRGMRPKIVNRLEEFTRVKAATDKRTSKRFDKGQWRITAEDNSWQLKHIYDLHGVINYMAKVPLDQNGKPKGRSERLPLSKTGDKPIREFGTFSNPRKHDN